VVVVALEVVVLVAMTVLQLCNQGQVAAQTCMLRAEGCIRHHQQAK
jgi:hypothetical protein